MAENYIINDEQMADEENNAKEWQKELGIWKHSDMLIPASYRYELLFPGNDIRPTAIIVQGWPWWKRITSLMRK